MKHLESTAPARGKGFSEPGHPLGLLPVFGMAAGESLPRLNFLDCKMGRLVVLARPDLLSQDRFRGSAQKMESRLLCEPRSNVEMVFLLKMGCRATRSGKLKGIEGLTKQR